MHEDQSLACNKSNNAFDTGVKVAETPSRLAIIVGSASKPSETFIREHIRSIAPGETVLVSSDESASQQNALVALDNIGGLARAKLIRAALDRIKHLRFSRIYPLPVAIGEETRLLEGLRAHGVTHVLIEYAHVAAQFIEILKRAGFVVWVHAHGVDVTTIPQIRRLRSPIIRTMKVADGVFVPSQYIKDIVTELGCATDKVVISPCGVNSKVFSASTHEPGRLLMVGRMVEKKAPLNSLRAMRAIVSACPHSHLDIVGEGPLLEESKAFVVAHGLGGHVKFHGSTSHAEVQTLMSRTSIFIQHSVTATNGDREGLPVALLEAMATGVPVVSTYHSGIPEAVADKVTGYLTAEHDIETFGERIIELLRDPAKAQAMGEAGRKRFEEGFTVERMVERIRAAMRFSA